MFGAFLMGLVGGLMSFFSVIYLAIWLLLGMPTMTGGMIAVGCLFWGAFMSFMSKQTVRVKE